MRNAAQVIDAIHGAYMTGTKHGLDNTFALLDALHVQPGCGIPQGIPAPGGVPVIHVAGTNGKGSTCAMLESILRRSGYRTGLYTSPFLQVYNERIRLNGVPVSDALLETYGNPLIDAVQALEDRGVQATPFELGTALALSIFDGEQVDVTIVEVGLGGRLDPTNVVKPCLCAITAIGLDHMNYLGDTLPQIAWEKAGIIKSGVPVVCHPAADEVAAVFAAEAEKKAAPLLQLRQDMILQAETDLYGSRSTMQLSCTWENVRISLPGEHQLTNTLTVLAMVEQLRAQGWSIPDEAVEAGIAGAVWPARLEWCGNILIDGAHNPQGVAALKRYVDRHLADRRCVLLTGAMADKLQPDMLRDLASMAGEIITVTPDNPRAMSAPELAQRLSACGGSAQAADSLEAGLTKAKTLAGPEGVVIAAGSLYFAGALRTLLGLAWR